MATIKEIAEIVGVSSSAVSRVLNYDEGISVSDETREAIFATAEKIGYKKRVIYPKIENVALLYFVDHEDELEDVFYHGVKDEIIKQAKKNPNINGIKIVRNFPITANTTPQLAIIKKIMAIIATKATIYHIFDTNVFRISRHLFFFSIYSSKFIQFF